MDAEDYDPRVPLERAWTPPAAWYRGGDHPLELATTFRSHWLSVGRLDEVSEPGSYFSGRIGGESFVVLRDEQGELRALHNVCRHHAAPLVKGAGRCAELVCPYHGWTYALDGSLRRAPGLGAAEAFDREAFGLPTIPVTTFGPLVLLNFEVRPTALDPALGAALEPSSLSRLVWVAQRRYELACDWKVFVENYLDGGYHVPRLHPDLATQLDIESYATELDGSVVVQRCGGVGGRVGDAAIYAWMHPNLMLNRYGPVLDVNVVVPLGPERCEVVFDWWMEPAAARDAAFVERALAASEAVQREDIEICEAVQQGLRSSSYARGRLAPRYEAGMHLFHKLLARDRGGD